METRGILNRLFKRSPIRFDIRELSGSLGDLGVFLPLAAGLASRCGMNFGHILFFTGIMNLGTGLWFGIPIPIQPMKIIAAVAIAEGLNAETVMAAGILMGAIILILAMSGLIDLFNRLIPKALVRGLQLVIGIKLLIKGVELAIGSGSWFAPDSIFTASICFTLAIALFAWNKSSGALILFLLGVGLSFFIDPAALSNLRLGWELPHFQIPSGSGFVTAFWMGTLPQLPMTILNAIIAVSALSIDLFPDRPVSPKSAAISQGLMNVVFCPFGCMPVCHGAGGLAAQYRFGARTGGSMIILGAVKTTLAVVFGTSILAIIAVYPGSVLGVLLLFAGWQMMVVCRDVRGKRDIFLVALTAGTCLVAGLAVGFVVSLALAMIVMRASRAAEDRSQGANGRQEVRENRRTPIDEE
jgi:MFS superfamily sulfate permease-like transporter